MLLPEPDAPMMAMYSPGWKSTVTPRRAWTVTVVDGPRRRFNKPPPPGVPHLVDLGHVDQPDDRLAGRRADSLVQTHWSDPPVTAAGPPTPAAGPPTRAAESAAAAHRRRRRNSSSVRPSAASAWSACSSVIPAFVFIDLFLFVVRASEHRIRSSCGQLRHPRRHARALASWPCPPPCLCRPQPPCPERRQ